MGTSGRVLMVMLLVAAPDSGAGAAAPSGGHDAHRRGPSRAPASSADEHDAHGRVGPAPESHPPSAPLGLSQARIGSGTSWLPDSSPAYAWHQPLGRWRLMVHGNLFAGLDAQGSERGATELASINWLMGMLSGPAAGGELAARVMLSAEPWTVANGGYPLLLQSGETWRGEPLRDRQHPHDLFMELALTYAHELADGLAGSLYLGLPGEPALGPTAYPHRVSAIFNPLAPLGHHWQDSTHIAFGVVTAGLYTRRLRIEASAFNGREPDKHRTDIETAPLDSFSGRIQAALGSDWTAQVSVGRLREPEALHPEDDVTRATASIAWNRRLARSGNLASTLVWGANVAHDETTHSFTLEGALGVPGERHVVVGRLEVVQKSGEELVVPVDRVFLLGSLSLGYLFELPELGFAVPGIGAVGTVNLIPRGLEPFYGSQVPVGGFVFIHLRPPVASAHGH